MAFSRALAAAAVADGIRVVGVNPGPVETDRLTSVFKARQRQRLATRAAIAS
jgi:NAD(P)-dependent dehydrogenase (short-subunit alcohol dehydrogenase family)